MQRGVAPPTWGQLVRGHAAQYAGLVLLLLVLAASERWEPFRRPLYVGQTNDIEYWRYSYPLLPNHVPAWAVPCIAVFTPLLLVVAARLAGRISRAEAHHAILLALYCVATTGTLTNWVKINVGRPRPHFVNRCWPNGLKPVFTPDGVPLCADSAIDPMEGIKSFPSGHTSWSTSGLGFASFWLLGFLRVFDGSVQPLRFVGALSPLLGALWIGMSRIQDKWHHEEDVIAGFSLGLLMAWLFYRQAYGSVMGPHAGMLTSAVRGGSGGRLVASGSSSRFPLYGGSGSEGADEQALYASADDKV